MFDAINVTIICRANRYIAKLPMHHNNEREHFTNKIYLLVTIKRNSVHDRNVRKWRLVFIETQFWYAAPLTIRYEFNARFVADKLYQWLREFVADKLYQWLREFHVKQKLTKHEILHISHTAKSMKPSIMPISNLLHTPLLSTCRHNFHIIFMVTS